MCCRAHVSEAENLLWLLPFSSLLAGLFGIYQAGIQTAGQTQRELLMHVRYRLFLGYSLSLPCLRASL